MSFLVDFFELLNRKTTYAVLRNYEGLPDEYQSRDIDILIDQVNFKKIKKDIYNLAKSYDYKVLLFYKAAGHVAIFFQNKNICDNIIQFDFLFNVSVKGILIFNSSIYLNERLFNGKVYYLPPVLEFLDKYLYNKLLGQEYPIKYSSLLEKVVNEYSDELKKWLIISLGSSIHNLEEVERLSTATLVRIISKKNKGIHFKIYSVKYAIYTLANLVNPQGLFISFTGPDGVGKTTVLNMVADTYRSVWNEEATKIHHFRPDFLPRIAILLHKTGAVKNVDENYEKPHRGKNSGIIGSIIRLLYYMCDYQLGYWKEIFPRRFRRQVTIFDRYFSDIIIDSERSNIKLPFKTIYSFGKLIPQPEYRVLIYADVDVILDRKQELSKTEINRIQSIMEWLKTKNKQYIFVENNGSAKESTTKILNEILDKQDRKYQKYFC